MTTTDILLVPGLNTMGIVWGGVIAAMPKSLACHPVDCPALPTVEAIADSLLADAPAKFHLAGYSFGGYVALAILARAPERIANFALVASSTYADTTAQAAFRQGAIERAQKGEHEALSMEWLPLTLHESHRADPAYAKAFHPMMMDYGAERYIAHQRACMARPDRTSLIAESGKRVLVVTGDTDTVVPVERQRRMAAAISGAQFTVIEQAGHLMPMEQPRALAAALTEWAEKS